MSSDDNRELAQDGSAKIKRHSSDHGKSLVYNRDDSEDDDFKPSAKRKIRPIVSKRVAFGSFSMKINQVTQMHGFLHLLRHLETSSSWAWTLQTMESESLGNDSESEPEKEENPTLSKLSSQILGLSISSENDFRNGVVWYIPIPQNNLMEIGIERVFKGISEKITFSNSTNLVPLLGSGLPIDTKHISDLLVKLRFVFHASSEMEENAWIERIFKDQRRTGGFARSLTTACLHLAPQYKLKDKLRQSALQCGVSENIACCCLRTLQVWAISKAVNERLQSAKAGLRYNPLNNGNIAWNIEFDHSVASALSEAEAFGVRIDIQALKRCSSSLRRRHQDLMQGREARLRARHTLSTAAADKISEKGTAERQHDSEAAKIGLDLRRFVNPLWKSLESNYEVLPDAASKAEDGFHNADTEDMKRGEGTCSALQLNGSAGVSRSRRSFPRAFLDLAEHGAIALSRPALNRWPTPRSIPREERTILPTSLEHLLLQGHSVAAEADPHVFVQPDPEQDAVHGWGLIMSSPCRADSGKWFVEVSIFQSLSSEASQSFWGVQAVACSRVHPSRQDSDLVDLRAVVTAENGSELLQCRCAVDLNLWAAAALSADAALTAALAQGADPDDGAIFERLAAHWSDVTQAVPARNGPRLARVIIETLVSQGSPRAMRVILECLAVARSCLQTRPQHRRAFEADPRQG